MNIQNNYKSNQPNFGIKVPVKTAIDVASGRFLRGAKVSYPAEKDLLSKLGNIDSNKLYTGEYATASRNMSKLIRERHPEINAATEKIGKECDIINKDRTFKPQDEVKISQKISQMLDNEANAIGKKEIDIEPMSLKELGLDLMA